MRILRTIAVLIVILMFATPDLLACGDKFLLAGRGTRYQRPKNAREAYVLIYVDPASAVTIKKGDLWTELSLQGHRVTLVTTLQNIPTLIPKHPYDVIFAPRADIAKVQQLVPNSPNAATVLPIDDPLKNHSVGKAIDEEVVRRDQNVRNQKMKKSGKH